MADILIQGLTQNNLKHVTFRIPKEAITVFTGVSGSGKSSIVFDTIAAESQRQMNATYPAFVRARLPKYPKPAVERIDNLTACVVVDQSPLGGNARSTVGTISGLYASLRLLFSRIGTPRVGTASYFSFNDPNGMCKTCSGLGKVTKVDVEAILDLDKSWNEGCVRDSLYRPGSGTGSSTPAPACSTWTSPSRTTPPRSITSSSMAPGTAWGSRKTRR